MFQQRGAGVTSGAFYSNVSSKEALLKEVVRRRQGIAYSGRSLTRMSPALTPNTPASASAGSTPCRTSARDQLV